MPEPISDPRLDDARAFLREAVFRSRALQASRGAGQAADGSGLCGLGSKAAVVLDLSDRGRELFERIWPGDLDEPSVERVHEAMRAWVRRQDALDRKRNHFLKAFRNEHGFDRRAYSPEELAAYDGGLASINGEVDSELDSAARELLSFTAS